MYLVIIIAALNMETTMSSTLITKPAQSAALSFAIVDDDAEQRGAVSGALDRMGDCHTFGSAELFFEHLRALNASPSSARSAPHLIVLDWGLPGMSGLMAVKELRAKGVRTPVLFLTSRDSEKDVVAALSAGADDYLVKPFRAGELAARARNLLRRMGLASADNGAASEQAAPTAANYGVEINRSTSSIKMPNQDNVALTQREFELANYFFERLNQPLARDDIMNTVWHHADSAASRTLDTHISKIRVKLNLRPELGWRLTPVYSYGYRLDYQEGA